MIPDVSALTCLLVDEAAGMVAGSSQPRYLVVSGVWCVVCGVVCVVCGVGCVVCRVSLSDLWSCILAQAAADRCDIRGVWCVVCGVWCVVCGVWCVVCQAAPWHTHTHSRARTLSTTP